MANKAQNEAGGGTSLQGGIAREQVAGCKFQRQTRDLGLDKETGEPVGRLRWDSGRSQRVEQVAGPGNRSGPVLGVRPSWCAPVGMAD